MFLKKVEKEKQKQKEAKTKKNNKISQG